MNSNIADYYKDKSIFLTGATGFLGKVLIEKLLKSCDDLKCIYILIRNKKGQDAEARLKEVLNFKIFENVKNLHADIFKKLIPIQGDLLEPNMGISDEDEKTLCENVNIVFHSAATVRFDEPLKLAVEMNVRGVKKMISLAKKMKKLEVFVHVSTAYANCDRQHVTEVIYNPPVTPEKILEACDWMEDDLVDLLTPNIIKLRPNTYTYTKAIAENLIKQAENEIPFVIVRPSIVTSAWREPLPGWIDNYNGPTALIAAAGKGILRTMYGNREAVADIIPVDIPVNLMIATAWYRGTKQTSETIIYNSTSGLVNPLKWGHFEKLTNVLINQNPYEQITIPPYVKLTRSKTIQFLKIFFQQLIPASIFDLFFVITHRKPRFIRIQKKLLNATETLEFFTTNSWEFTNDNVLFLKTKLNEIDSQVFNFDIKDLDWCSYIEQYCLGIKTFVLKEDLSKMNICRKELEM